MAPLDVLGDASFPTRPFVGPGRVLLGAGASGSLAQELVAAGVDPSAGSVIVVPDAAVIALGLAAPALASLEAAGFAVLSGPPVAAEPTPEVVLAFLPEDPATRVAAVVGIGGGSAMDAAKLVSVALANDLDLTQVFPPGLELRPGPLVALVPTTAGTGAEATVVAMLWHDGAKRIFVHPHLVPDIAVLDPDLLRALPAPVTAAGGLDAISHAMESLLSTFSTPMTQGAAASALRNLARWLPVAYDEGTPESRAGTLLGAYEAGLALNAGVVLGHSLAYTIASRARLGHGITCAMALPYCLAYNRPAAGARLAAIADAVGVEGGGEELVGWVADLADRLATPGSLAAVGIGAADLPEMARECVELYPRPGSPVPLEAGRIERVLACFLEGDARGAWAAMA